MSFDKQNFARTVSEQQAGISPQMWPIKIDPCNGGTPGPNTIGLNSPFEIEINPCDAIWLPITYDKSYGANPIQSDATWGGDYPDPTVAGSNIFEMWQGDNLYFKTAPPLFGLRFNSPNNPWLLWGLGQGSLNKNVPQMVGFGVANMRAGGVSLMRSITGPISRLWCQYYAWGFVQYDVPLTARVPFYQQVILLSTLGFAQETQEWTQPVLQNAANDLTFPNAPPDYLRSISSGAYRTPDLNSADLRVLGQNPLPVAPTTAGAGSTKG